MAFNIHKTGCFSGFRYSIVSMGYLSTDPWLVFISPDRVLWFFTKVETYNKEYQARTVYTDGRKFLIRIEVDNKVQRIRLRKNLSLKIWKSIIECGISDIDSFRCSVDATNTSIYLGTPVSFLLAVSGLRDK